MSAILFVGLALGVALGLIWWVFGSFEAAINYFRTQKGRKVAQGILAFVGVAVLAVGLAQCASAGERGQWFAWGEVYLGIDRQMRGERSPQCMDDGPDNRLTSNGGFRANIYQSGDGRMALNGKYTHHSCAFNTDRNLYDALGVELTYRLW